MTIPVVLLCLCFSVAYGCQPRGFTVTKSGDSAAPENINAYTLSDVENHFELGSVEYVDELRTPFSCVDARGDEPLLGTPGGDFVELVVAISAYFAEKEAQSASFTPTLQLVRDIVDDFMSDVITTDRPLYYHTDFGRLSNLLRDYEIEIGQAQSFTIFPSDRPTPSANAQTLLNLLKEPEYQGCGHLRLMLEDPDAYGLPSAFVPETLLQELIEWWWDAPAAEQAKFLWVTKLGPLEGKAVTIVTSDEECPGFAPAYPPNLRGSTSFLYHATAVTNFREQVVAPFFKTYDPSIDEDDLLERINDLAGVQLTQTLTLLDPANSVDIFTVTVDGVASPPPPPSPSPPSEPDAGTLASIMTSLVLPFFCMMLLQ